MKHTYKLTILTIADYTNRKTFKISSLLQFVQTVTVCTNRKRLKILNVLRFVQIVSHSKFQVTYGLYKPQNSRYRKTDEMFYCFAVCTNRKSLEISNDLWFLQIAKQFNSKRKRHHRRSLPPIHHNYLYNAKLNLQ